MALTRNSEENIRARVQCDYSWKIDFGQLHEFAGGNDIGRAVLYGSRPPANEVFVQDRNVVNREKK
jgi:hypothetical protein